MKLLYTPILLLFSVACFAQKPLSVTYYKEGFRPVKTIDSADFVRAILPPDTTSPFYRVRDYYAANKKIKFVGTIEHRNNLNGYEGKCEAFYPNGNVKLKAFYRQGRILGTAYEYDLNGKLHAVKKYATSQPGQLIKDPLIIACFDSTAIPIVNNGNGYYKGYRTTADFDDERLYEEGPVVNGLRNGTWQGSNNPIKLIYDAPATLAPKIKFTEQYENGKLISGVATDSTGTQHRYTQRMHSFDYKGGMQKFSEYLQKNLNYPLEARANNIQGQVYISFEINADGSITNAKIARGVNAELDNEALRAIKHTHEWQPEEEFGVPVKTRALMPVSFTLK